MTGPCDRVYLPPEAFPVAGEYDEVTELPGGLRGATLPLVRHP